ncbi:hypothetical protein PIB30_089507 [Stylosanthes scabra]|uniref:Uncharacterized protein n=1 Tax=Stylosanthes scabra TaxID=79078 RepID=A0ABU6TWC4_9FABA|nr:hypothetical protein [Stylosanthes scabra]
MVELLFSLIGTAKFGLWLQSQDSWFNSQWPISKLFWNTFGSKPWSKKETLVPHHKKNKGQHNINIILIQGRKMRTRSQSTNEGLRFKMVQEGQAIECARLHKHVPAAVLMLQVAFGKCKATQPTTLLQNQQAPAG